MDISNFIIDLVNGTYMYGTNETVDSNGVLNWELVGPKLVLSSYLNGKAITEVGKYAFSHCYYLIELYIEEGIKVINTHAFAFITNLTSVIIPPSVESIMYCALHGYNISSPTFTSKGIMTVTFAGESKIK